MSGSSGQSPLHRCRKTAARGLVVQFGTGNTVSANELNQTVPGSLVAMIEDCTELSL